MHFVSIFATSAEVFIRCAVIPAHSNFHFAYNSVSKGTRCAMNCLKMHFVSIFATSAEVFIRCAVILAHSNFHFAYNSILKGTRCATNCLKMHFVSIFTTSAEVYIHCLAIYRAEKGGLRIKWFLRGQIAPELYAAL